jgi:hypothetical protein
MACTLSQPGATMPVVFSLSLDAPAPGAARLRLEGHLDDEAAREVLHAAADVVKCGCSRLVVDLGGVVSFDDAASYAVVGCSQLSRYLPDGVTVVADSDAGSALADTAGVASHRAAAHLPGTMVACPAC